MKVTFDSNLVTSFYLWLNNKIIKDGEGFANKEVVFYKQNDSARTNLTIYANPFKSLVYDSCQTNATILSGVYNSSGQFLTRESGLFFDYINGRVFSSGNWGNQLSGSVAKNDYNLYYTTDEEVNLLLEKVYENNKNLSYDINGVFPLKTGAKPYDFYAPCIFMTSATSENVPFALGGTDMSKRSYRLYAISDNNFNQESLQSLLIDQAHNMIPILSNADMPINFYGDLKNGSFNYCNLRDSVGCSSGAYIKNVFHYKIDPKSNKSNTFLVSFFDFDLEIIRNPRNY